MSAQAEPRRETMIALRARREALHVASAVALPELHVEQVPPPPPVREAFVVEYLPPPIVVSSIPTFASKLVDGMCIFVLVAGMLCGIIAVVWSIAHP